MEEQEIRKLFARASRLNEDKAGYHTQKEWDSMKTFSGAKTIKRRLLGFCGWQSLKSLEEMAQILYETGIASSVEDGRKIVPSLVGVRIEYSRYDDGKTINFAEVVNSQGQKMFRVRKKVYCSPSI